MDYTAERAGEMTIVIVECVGVDFSHKLIPVVDDHHAENIIRDVVRNLPQESNRAKVAIIEKRKASEGQLLPLVAAARDGELSKWIRCSLPLTLQ